MTQFSRGFLVGGQNCTILIFERHEELKSPYISDKKIQVFIN
jgi:hypothetical protein